MIRYLKMDLIAGCVAVASLFLMQRPIQLPVRPATQTEQETPVQASSMARNAIQQVQKKTRRPLRVLANLGMASWYGSVWQGRRTASGEIFDEGLMTACHRTLPFGTLVRVVDVNSGKSVVVKINDRGTLTPDRIIDLSSAAAQDLGILRAGVAKVRLEVLSKVEKTAKTLKREADGSSNAEVPPLS